MNTLKGIILTLAATCSLSQAQQAGIPALIQGKNIPGGQYLITGVSGKNNFTAVQMRNGNAVGNPIGGRISDCTTFYISTPKAFAEAVDAFRAGKLQQAQQGFAKVKTSYKIVQSIPGNLSVRSALLEIDSAIRQKDWAAVKALAAALPGADLTPENKLHAQVAELLGNIADKQWDAIIENGNKILASNKNNLTMPELGWLQYAMGRAYQGQLGDTPDLTNRDNAVKANAAIDAYSTTIAASHGSYMELPAEAMGRAAIILSLLPEAAAYIEKHGNSAPMESDKKKAPQAIKDAAALAYIYLNVVSPGSRNDKLNQLAQYYYNSMEKPKGAAAPAAAPAAEAKPADKPAAKPADKPDAKK